MKKLMLTMGMAFAVAAASAVEAVQAETDVDPDMELFGGYVRKPRSAKGKVVFLNAQKRVAEKDMKGAFDEVEERLKFNLEVKAIDKVNLPNPKADLTALGATLGVAIIDSPEYPALVAAPEDGWALVNVAALNVGEPKAEVLAARTRKELLRALGMVGGCAFMARGAIVMRKTVRDPRDLDAIKIENYGVDALNAFAQTAPLYGVVPWAVMTYEDACMEGWAPAPTNKYQQAVWDQVHALPKTPMKIEFDPKAGR